MNCQAVDCVELALPWVYALDFGEVEIAVYVCRRHERALLGRGLDFRPTIERAYSPGKDAATAIREAVEEEFGQVER